MPADVPCGVHYFLRAHVLPVRSSPLTHSRNRPHALPESWGGTMRILPIAGWVSVVAVAVIAYGSVQSKPMPSYFTGELVCESGINPRRAECLKAERGLLPEAGAALRATRPHQQRSGRGRAL